MRHPAEGGKIKGSVIYGLVAEVVGADDKTIARFCRENDLGEVAGDGPRAQRVFTLGDADKIARDYVEHHKKAAEAERERMRELGKDRKKDDAQFPLAVAVNELSAKLDIQHRALGSFIQDRHEDTVTRLTKLSAEVSQIATAVNTLLRELGADKKSE